MVKIAKTELESAIDAHVGLAIRARRAVLGQTQSTLAATLNRSYQQIQNYESGQNRVSASLLYRLAEAQGVDVSFYFAGFAPPDERFSRAETSRFPAR